MHRSHASLSSFDDIQRQLQQPRTRLLSVHTSASHHIQPRQSHLINRSKRPGSAVGIVQWTSSFVVKDHNEQRALIRFHDQFPVCSMHLAAMCIQRWWRSLEPATRTRRSDRRTLTNPEWLHPYQQLIRYISLRTLHMERRCLPSIDFTSTESMLAYFNSCASVIQRSYRAYHHRRSIRYQRRMLYHKAACSIQRAWRAYIHKRKSKEQHFIDRVVTIQRAWRSFNDRRVYRYFRSLIRSRESSDPRQILQALGEPDDSNGLYIRFRLGGSQFPPLIYFKVFTKQTVTDIGAFAPRNYALDQRRQREQRKVVGRAPSSKGWKQQGATTDIAEWYRRYENNGWRLMSTTHLHSSLKDHQNDEVTLRTSNIRTWHHPNKLVRAADARRKRKEKQIAWKRDLYCIQVLNDTNHDEKECVTLPKLVHGSPNDPHLLDVLDSQEDDLLDWCRALSFNDYSDGWRSMGTTDHQPSRVAVKLPSVGPGAVTR